MPGRAEGGVQRAIPHTERPPLPSARDGVGLHQPRRRGGKPSLARDGDEVHPRAEMRLDRPRLR
jgi:hypothetical protein